MVQVAAERTGEFESAASAAVVAAVLAEVYSSGAPAAVVVAFVMLAAGAVD